MIRIGIICPSEIAFRRFMPAVKNVESIEFVGVAYATCEEWMGNSKAVVSDQIKKTLEAEHQKALSFTTEYGGKVFEGYEAMLSSGKIDAVYLPLPPALHYQWAKKALEYGLHVLIEKPSTTNLSHTKDLVGIAEKSKRALHENYMFVYHNQLDEVKRAIDTGKVGTVKLIRIDFGFPARPASDFRYNKKLGGGALLDCGGYTLKYADLLLGGNAKIDFAKVTYDPAYEVEMFGTASMSNENNEIVQVAFGMDNDYRCSINVWGSEATLTSNRILTAPDGYKPEYTLSKNGKTETITMEADDTFSKSIRHFVLCVEDDNVREDNYKILLHQEMLIDSFMKIAGMCK